MELTLNRLTLSLEEQILLILRNLQPKEPIEYPIGFDQIGNKQHTHQTRLKRRQHPRQALVTQVFKAEFGEIANAKPTAPEKSVSSGALDNQAREKVESILHLEPEPKDESEKPVRHTNSRKL
jgi:hypothetical protein